MSRKRIIWTIVLLVVTGGSWYIYKEYTRTHTDLINVRADIKISAADMIKEYETNDSAANKKYLGKIVELAGNIKDVKKDESGFYNVVLGDMTSLSSVRCSIDTVHQPDAARLAIGSSTIVRGACTGFNKDEMGLGSDVILNRCVIIEKK
jgi:hypothetical protein